MNPKGGSNDQRRVCTENQMVIDHLDSRNDKRFLIVATAVHNLDYQESGRRVAIDVLHLFRRSIMLRNRGFFQKKPSGDVVNDLQYGRHHGDHRFNPVLQVSQRPHLEKTNTFLGEIFFIYSISNNK